MSIISRRFGAAALAMGLVLASGESFAQAQQQQQQQPRPAQQQQQQRPAQQQPAQPPAAQQPPANRVELRATQPEWTKVCGKDEAANKEICYTTRDFGQAADQPPVLAVAVYDVKGDAQRIVRLLLPVGLLLRPGFRFSIDKGAALEGAYEICFPNGCFAETTVNEAQTNALKRGQQLNVSVQNQAAREVTFQVPMAGFAKAFDGAPIDPAELQKQQENLQEELRKREDELRRRLQGEATPGAPAAPRP